MVKDMWKQRGTYGPFSSIDPYHKGRKQVKAAIVRSPAANTSSPNTPAIVKTELPSAATPPVTIHLRVPKPEGTPGPILASVSPAAAPATPATPAADAKSRETRGARAAAVAATAKMTSPVKATQQLPPQPPRAGPTGWHHLSPDDNAVVAATDAAMPIWQGPKIQLPGDPAPGGHPGSGWWGEGSPDYERSVGGVGSYKQRIHAVAEAMTAYKDPS